MRKKWNTGLVWLFVGITVSLNSFNAHAFALLGPYEPWMTQSNGFHIVGDIGGPKKLGEEYRWNVPTVTYSFDPSFAQFFGAQGEAAVNGAIQILNNLSPASQIDPDTYPLDTRSENASAQAQGLVDLKSETLSLLLQRLGLASPQRFMFCVHDFSVANGTSNAVVILRNFDPITYAPTNVMNGTLFASNVVWQFNNDWGASAIAYAFPVNPFAPFYTAVADAWAGSYPGWFYTGLTRDDVGGLRYLLQTNNYNLEPLLPDVQGAGSNADNYVNLAPRAGVDKITFVQKTVDSLTGQFPSPFSYQYTDFYLANGVLMRQQLERVTTQPDIVFSAYDGSGEITATLEMVGATNWSNDGLAGVAGPGIIHPQVTIAFPKFGMNALAITSDSGITQLSNYRWASFDASANAPLIYPAQAVSGGYPWTMQLALVNSNYQSLPGGYFTWQLPVALGATALLETSTNLADWTPLTTVTNYGAPFLWEHVHSQPSQFYRVVPQ